MIGKYEITAVRARQIFDSRGNPTIEVDVQSGKGFGRASVPSGVSKGKLEAVELRDGGKAYNGLGVLKAVENIKMIEKELLGRDCRDQEGIDHLLIELDGTKNKSHLGANTILAVSMACAKAAASSKECWLYEHLSPIYEHAGIEFKMPIPFFNVINGGKHAMNKLPIQEFMIAPIGAESFSEAMRISTETYHALKSILQSKFKNAAIGVGDEGGFVAPIKTAEEALKLLEAAVKKAGHKKKVAFAMDVAASSLYKSKKYNMGTKKMSSEQLLKYYIKLVEKYPIINIEDPFHEQDFDSFAALVEAIGENVQITGDDIFVTNAERIVLGIRKRAANALLLKLNQVGTVSEAMSAARMADRAGWNIMVSHRSGETCDSFISDFAVAIGAKQIKAGAPCRGERLAKYNQLLRIEEHTQAPYAGKG
ncbi:MAG: phosphopyruvate hydratase [Candidatus Diapherotrites archaeon]|nr:phosphopyruvate hydratase [Candidatus Diapherotrites archaeon]